MTTDTKQRERDMAALVEAAQDAVAIIDRIDAHYAHNPTAGIRQPEFPLRVPRAKLDAIRAALEPFLTTGAA